MKRDIIRGIRVLIIASAFIAISAAIVFPPGLLFLGHHRSCDPSKTRFSSIVLPTPRGLVAQGLAWGDYDNDGWDDLFVAAYPAGEGSVSRLYRNENSTLTDRTKSTGLPDDLTASSGFFADYDNDGWRDLFVMEVVWSTGPAGRPTSRLRVFTNHGGTFTERTKAFGLDSIRSASSAGALTFADFDQDGDLDIAVTFLGTLRRYWLQPTSTLLGVAARFGAGGTHYIAGRGEVERVLAAEPELASRIADDFGRETFLASGGFLVSTPVAPGLILPLRTQLPMQVLAELPGSLQILRNDRTSFPLAYTFDGELPLANREVAAGMTWPHSSRRFFQPMPLYLSGDERIDLFAATDFGRNLLLENDGQFRFRDVTAERGMAVFGTGMGVALGDTRRSGALDLVVTNFGRLFRFQRKDDRFRLDPNESLNRLGFGWGVAFTDVENDGWPDLYVSNGWPRFHFNANTERDDLTASYTYAARDPFFSAPAAEDRLYHNRSGRFTNRTSRDICADNTSTFPVAVADFDRNGAEDIALGTVYPLAGGKSVTVFQNRGTPNHFVQMKLIGTRSNRDGVGATITLVMTDGSRQSQAVLIGESFYAQHSLVKTFGLGPRRTPITVEILWPSGILQHVSVAADSRTTIIEPPS